MNAKTAQDAFIESQTVLVLSRLAMLSTPILIALLIFFGRFWIESQFDAQAATTTQLRADVNDLSESQQSLKDRTKVVEINQDRGRAERIEFQQTVLEQQAQIIAQQQTLAQQMAALTATIQAQQRELDKRPR